MSRPIERNVRTLSWIKLNFAKRITWCHSQIVRSAALAAWAVWIDRGLHAFVYIEHVHLISRCSRLRENRVYWGDLHCVPADDYIYGPFKKTKAILSVFRVRDATILASTKDEGLFCRVRNGQRSIDMMEPNLPQWCSVGGDSSQEE